MLRWVRAIFCSAAMLTGSAVANAQEARDAIYLTPEEIQDIRSGSACKSALRQVLALQEKMSGVGIETDYYSLKIIPTDELVRGHKGKYYAVALKDARRKQRLYFPSGRYVIRKFDNRFKASFSAFARDVLAKFGGGLDYNFYVRGSASAVPMRRSLKLAKDFKIHGIDFLPKAAEGVYDGNRRSSLDIPPRYGNEELPYLRAAFLKRAVEQFVPFAQPTILESEVSQSRSRKQQFAEFLLFVEW